MRLGGVCQTVEAFPGMQVQGHTQLNDVNWNETGKYNKSLALALCNAAYACARARGVH